MSSSLSLSKRLRTFSDEQIAELVTARLDSTSTLKDFFDLADALLTKPAIVQALSRIPRAQLELLISQTSENNPLLIAELLGDEEVGVYPEVSAVLASLQLEPVLDIADASAVTEIENMAAIESALTCLGALDELTRIVGATPLKELARGGLSAQDVLRLSSLTPSDEISITDLLHLAQLGNLLELRGGWWFTTDTLPAWFALDASARWEHLSRHWLENIGGSAREILRQRRDWTDSLADYLAQEYPLDAQWMLQQLEPLIAGATALGLTSGGRRTILAEHVLDENWAGATAILAEVVPPYADHIYVQHDFTIIAPGPLRPADDIFMRQLCVVESRGLASTFRITHGGVNSLLAEGKTAADILGSLTNLASGDVPQAVAYFITEQADRFGLVRVRAGESHTQVTSSDDILLTTIAADRSLSALGLRKSATGTLISGISASSILSSLVEAKYPAQLENDKGEIIQPIPHGAPVQLRSELTSPLDTLIIRLRGGRAEAATDDATWIARQLDVAVREKTPLVVTVKMPDGTDREFFVEPKGFSNGRLRAHDKKTDVERTLPASHITAVRQAE